MDVIIRLAESPPEYEVDCLLVLEEAKLPVLIWPDVLVVRERRREITLLERFLLEASLQLEVFSASVVDEIISIPEVAVRRCLDQLVVQGALEREGGDSYRTERARAGQAIAQQAFVEYLEEPMDFLFFPRCGDLLVCPQEGGQRSRVSDLSRIEPRLESPVPRDIWERPSPADNHSEVGRGHYRVKELDYVQRRIVEGTIVNLPADVLGVAAPKQRGENGKQPSRTTLEQCPCFDCRGSIYERDGEKIAKLTVFGFSRKAKRRSTAAEMQPVRLTLNGTDRLINSWLELPETLELPANQTMMVRAILGQPVDTVKVKRIGPTRWGLHLGERAVASASLQKRSLVEPVGVTIEEPNLAKAVVAVTMVPADAAAAVSFAVDLAIRELAKAADPVAAFSKIVDQAREHYRLASSVEISAQRIHSRIWQLGHYVLIYRLREREDFCYASVD